MGEEGIYTCSKLVGDQSQLFSHVVNMDSVYEFNKHWTELCERSFALLKHDYELYTVATYGTNCVGLCWFEFPRDMGRKRFCYRCAQRLRAEHEDAVYCEKHVSCEYYQDDQLHDFVIREENHWCWECVTSALFVILDGNEGDYLRMQDRITDYVAPDLAEGESEDEGVYCL